MIGFLNHHYWDYVTQVAGAIGFVLSARFIIHYHWRTGGSWRRTGAWRDTAFGRYLMLRKATMLPLFAMVIVNRVFGEWNGRRAAVAILLLVFALETLIPYRLLDSVQAKPNFRKATNDVRQ